MHLSEKYVKIKNNTVCSHSTKTSNRKMLNLIILFSHMQAVSEIAQRKGEGRVYLVEATANNE